MGILYPVASGIHAFAIVLRFPSLYSLVIGIFAVLSLSYAEYFTSVRSGRITVAYRDCSRESWNQVDN